MSQVCQSIQLLIHPSSEDGKLLFGYYDIYSGQIVEDGISIDLTTNWSNIFDKPEFSGVALSGDYNDLINKPYIPGPLTGYVKSDWNASFGAAEILHKPDLSDFVYDVDFQGFKYLTETELDNINNSVTGLGSSISGKADKTQVNALSSRVDTNESIVNDLTVEVQSKVSQQDFDDYIAGAGDVAGLTVRITNAETAITQNANAITLKADKSTVDTLTGRVDDMEAELVVQADLIATKVSQTTYDQYVSDTSGTLGQLGTRITTAETSINQNANAISLKADKSVVDDLQGTVEQNSAQLVIQANQISTKVSNSQYTTDMNGVLSRISVSETNIIQNANSILLKADKTQVNSIDGRLVTAEGSISIMSTEIQSKVSQTEFDNLGNRVTTAESAITQNADNIELKVSETDFTGANLISKINVASGGVTISGSKIDLDGVVTFSSLSPGFVSDLTTTGGVATQSMVTDQTIYIEYSVNGTSGWHSTFTTGDQFMRQKKGTGAWSIAMRIVGINGVAGQSAYQIAVANGFIGTEADWLASLEGTDGTGIQIKGSRPTRADLDLIDPGDLTAGDSYLVDADGLLYIWDGTAWSSGTAFKGDPGANGTSSYVHIAYSNSSDGTVDFSTTHFEGATYIGFRTDSNTVDPTDPSLYAWTLVKGEQGPQGLQGIQGTQGIPGTTYYTWIKYADTPTTGMSDDGTGKKYIGIAYNKTTAVESTNYADYAWSLIKGTDGVPGADGTSFYTWIKYSDNADGTGLYDTPTPTTLYIGIAPNKSTPTESTNKTDYTWSKFKGDQGVAGAATYAHVAYARSVDGTVGFSTTDSTGATYIGMYVDAVEEDSQNPADYRWTLTKGADGPQGIPGTTGADGQTPYLHIAYADDNQGNGFSQSAEGKAWIGTYTDFTEADSSNPALYSWAKFRGDPVASPTEPTGKYVGMVWIDTSKTPPEQKTWNGTAWVIVGMSSQQAADYVHLQGLIDLSKGGKTIVIGGYINTQLVDTNALVVRDGSGNSIGTLIEGDKIRTGLINASQVVVDGGGISQTLLDDKIQVIDNQNAAASMVPALENWTLTGQTVVTITDGIEGDKAIRVTAGNGFPQVTTRIPLDRNKKYKTRVWARRSSDSNGTFTFCLRQFSDKNNPISDGVNGFSLKDPNGVTLTTSWVLYERIWIGTDFNVATKYFSPTFLDNFGATSGYYEIQGFTMKEVTDVIDVKDDLNDLEGSLGALAFEDLVGAAKLDSTIIEGGYIKTSLINANAIVVAGGGVNQDYIDSQLDTIDNDRNTDQPPSYYITNYPNRVIKEIKLAGVIGAIPSSDFPAVLQTNVGVSTPSLGAAGQVTQSFTIGTTTYTRYSATEAYWLSWVESETTTGAQSKANAARDTAITSATAVAANDATTKANNARSAAVADANANLQSRVIAKDLGINPNGIAYRNFVQLSDLDGTIIADGYIKTSLLDVDAILVGVDLSTVIPISDNLLPNSNFEGGDTTGWSLTGGAVIQNHEGTPNTPTLYISGSAGTGATCTNYLTTSYPSKDKSFAISFEIYPKSSVSDYNIGFDGAVKANIKINGSSSSLGSLSLNTWSTVTYVQKPTSNSAFVIKSAQSGSNFYVRKISIVTGENPLVPYKAADGDLVQLVNAKTQGYTIISGGLVQTGAVEIGSISQKTAFLSGIIDNGVNSIVIGAGSGISGRATAPFRVSQGGEVWMTNAHVSGEIQATSGSIGGFTISGDDLTNPSIDSSILFGSGTMYIKINESSTSPLLSLRTDQSSRTAIYIQTYGSGANGIYVLGNDPNGSQGNALEVHGNIKLHQRSGESWNAPGILATVRMQFNSSGSYTGFTSWNVSDLSISSISITGSNPYNITINHNIGHTNYKLVPIFHGTGGWISVGSENSSSATFQLGNPQLNSSQLGFMLVGANHSYS